MCQYYVHFAHFLKEEMKTLRKFALPSLLWNAAFKNL